MPEISAAQSLIVIATILVSVTVASVLKVRRDPTARAHAGSLRHLKPRPEHAPHD